MKSEFEVGASIVLNLTERLDGFGSDCVFTDRFFTSSRSVDALLARGIYQVRTVNKIRIGNVISSFKDDKEMTRGDYQEFVREDDTVSAIKWKDN